jgi:hypothetical protein
MAASLKDNHNEETPPRIAVDCAFLKHIRLRRKSAAREVDTG